MAKRRLRTKAGDVFLAASAGIFEAAPPRGEQFGIDRVGSLLTANAGQPASVVADRIGEAIDRHTGGDPPDDDRTVLVVKRAP